jgi:hypothetical protein
MQLSALLQRLGLRGPWSQELGLAALALAVSFGLMPVLIFYAGATSLGRYEGASLGRTFDSLYRGLGSGSSAAWIVFLGPYALILLFRGLRHWWRAGANLA